MKAQSCGEVWRVLLKTVDLLLNLRDMCQYKNTRIKIWFIWLKRHIFCVSTMVWAGYRLCYKPTYRNNICTIYWFTCKVFRFSSIFIIYIQVKNMICFLMNIQMDSMTFELYSGTHGGFTFNSSLNFISSDFSSRLFTIYCFSH